jgi:RNA polymerase sporulation-specific sigma factor
MGENVKFARKLPGGCNPKKLPYAKIPIKRFIINNEGKHWWTYNQTMVQYEKLIYFLMNRYDFSSHFNKDELYNIALFALWKAFKTFDHNKSANFTTYYSTIVLNEWRFELRKLKGKAKQYEIECFHLETPISFDPDGNNLALKDMLKSDHNLEDEVMYRAYLEQTLEYIRTFSKRDQEILYLRQIGKTQKEIGEILQLSQSYISRVVHNLHDKIRRKIIAL